MEQAIIHCEIHFAECFSKWTETPQVIRFRNSELPDMYDHNKAIIKTQKIKDDKELQNCMLEEIERSFGDGLNFTKLTLDDNVNEADLSFLTGEKEVSHCGFYLLDPAKAENWTENSNAHLVITAETEAHLEELTQFEIEEYGQSRGEDFCRRSVRYFVKLCPSTAHLQACLLYKEGELVGRCQLFLDGNTAKIEDVVVKASCRHQKMATTLLKGAVKKAVSEGAEQVYLVADEGDTPKQMYEKLGFERIGIWTEVFLKKKRA